MGWIEGRGVTRLHGMNPVQKRRIAVDARWVFRELSGIGRYTLELLRQLGERGGDFRFWVMVSDGERRAFVEQAARLAGIPDLAPGDFRTVRQGMYYLGGNAKNGDRLAALERESETKGKNRYSTKKIGF